MHESESSDNCPGPTTSRPDRERDVAGVSSSHACLGLAPAVAQEIPHPTDFFGFEIGTDGELARYPKILGEAG